MKIPGFVREHSWRRLRRLSLASASFGILLLLLAGALLTWSLTFYATTDAGHTTELLSRVQHLLRTLDDLETGQRGFLITGAERYLEPYRAAVARVEPELKGLAGIVSTDPIASARLSEISTLTREKISELEETIQLRREQGEDAARAIVLTDRGLRRINEIRGLIEQIEVDASARLAARAENQQKHIRRMELAALGGLLLGLIFILLVAKNIARIERSASMSEEGRKQQEGEFSQLADSIPQLAWMANADGWIFWYNRRWFEFTGTTPEQMEGWGWKVVHDPSILPIVMERWSASIATGKAFEMEFPLRGADGKFRSFLTRVMPLKNRQSEVVRWFGTNTDITDRVNAERDTAEFAAIVESSHDAIVGKDLNGFIVSWNPGAEKLYGYSRAEILGQSMHVLFPPDNLAEEDEILRRIRRGEVVDSHESTRITKAGEKVIVAVAVSSIRNKAGHIIGASHIARDITERKKFEVSMLETQKLETLGVLAGGIAHDFNNLLTGIMGNASLVMERMPVGNSDRVLLDAVLSASERAAALTGQLLAYAGKGRFVREPVDLSDVTRQIVQLVEASIPRKVSLILNLGRNLPLVEGDVSQLQQVIMNLVINGAEAIGNESGTVTVKTWIEDNDGHSLHTAVPSPNWTPGPSVALEVIDTGSGMNEETLSKIFDPFFTTKFTGRGLGLASVQGIIRRHHGTLEVSSTLGRGSRFRVLLPATSKRGSFTAGEKPIDPLQGHGHLLVVEDDQEIRRFVLSVLEQYGYSVEMAHNGRQAVEIFARNPAAFQLVFMDLTMPVMNGEEALRHLRIIRPGIPILLTSGYDSNAAIRDLTGQGVIGFIQKPFTARKLAEKIKESLPA